MKTLLIAAAALAAFSVSASAGTVAWNESTKSYTISADSWSKSDTDSNYSLTLGGTGFDLSQENWTISLTLTALPSTGANQWGTAPFASGSSPTATYYTNGFQSFIGVAGGIVVKGSDFDGGSYANGTTLGTVSKDEKATYTFLFVRTGDSTTFSILNGAGTTLGTSTKTITNWSGTITELSTSITDDQLTAGWTLAAGTISYQAIPEPAAFGILAGMGALTLAVSRRRRRSR